MAAKSKIAAMITRNPQNETNNSIIYSQFTVFVAITKQNTTKTKMAAKPK